MIMSHSFVSDSLTNLDDVSPSKVLIAYSDIFKMIVWFAFHVYTLSLAHIHTIKCYFVFVKNVG